MRVDSDNHDEISSTSSSQDLVHTPNGQLSTETFTITQNRNADEKESLKNLRKTTSLSENSINRSLKPKLSDHGSEHFISTQNSTRLRRHKTKIKKDTYDLPKTTKGWVIFYFKKYIIVISIIVCILLIWLFGQFKNKHPELVKSKPSEVWTNYKMPENYTENSIKIQDSGRIDVKDYYQKNRNGIFPKWQG